MEMIKTLFSEALENPLVAGSCLFLIIAFFSAIPEPTAALLPLVVSMGFYGVARMHDKDS